jgi:hypothetical protein
VEQESQAPGLPGGVGGGVGWGMMVRRRRQEARLGARRQPRGQAGRPEGAWVLTGGGGAGLAQARCVGEGRGGAGGWPQQQSRAV